MTESEKIYAASYAIGKNLDCDQLRYSDVMYGKEDQTEDVWEYVDECASYGSVAFREKYKEHKLHWEC